MPATQQLIKCDHCRVYKTRAEMSVTGDICLECFDRSYRFCEACGEVIKQVIQTPPFYRHDCTFCWDGLNLCYNCHGHQCYGEGNWKPTSLPWAKVSYDKIGSERKFGVEIETSACPKWQELRGHTFFGVKNDCSIDGKEFDSPVLYGDEGLDHVRELLAYAEQEEWEVDDACGCHTHYDMRDLSYEQLCDVAYAYRKSVAVWRALVHPDRRDHEYSTNYNWTCDDFKQAKARCASFPTLLNYLSIESYEYIRLTAYTSHNTFENRMLEGCLDADTLCAWIKLNCLFIDTVKDMSITKIDGHFGRGQRQEHFGPMCDLIGDVELTDWMRSRGEQNDRPFDPA